MQPLSSTINQSVTWGFQGESGIIPYMPKNPPITGLFGSPAQHPAFPSLKALCAAAQAMPLPITVEDKKRYYVVQDDELIGGAKIRHPHHLCPSVSLVKEQAGGFFAGFRICNFRQR